MPANMVPGRRNGNGYRIRLPVPLLLGFVVGFAYTYYLLSSARHGDADARPSAPETSGRHNEGRHYHLVDTTGPSADLAIPQPSVFCVVFVEDVDALLVQRNVWLDKCADAVYASARPIEYADRPVVTDTFSEDPWTHWCRTLVRVAAVRSGRRWTFLARDRLWLIPENLARLTVALDAERRYHAGRYGPDGALDVDAGVLLSAATLTALARLLDDGRACDDRASGDEGRTLDYYLRVLNSTPVVNKDLYGCSLFNSLNLFDAFDTTGLKTDVPKTCLSRSAISFQLDLFPNYYAMFYKYALYQIRLVDHQDLMSKDILPPQHSDDLWRIEALYELNLDPMNMTQADFFHFWIKKRQIIL